MEAIPASSARACGQRYTSLQANRLAEPPPLGTTGRKPLERNAMPKRRELRTGLEQIMQKQKKINDLSVWVWTKTADFVALQMRNEAIAKSITSQVFR
jgi:hypothetical protein